MAYTAWSVVFGEQPTAAKWNQLGENDAGFKDGTNIDDAAIITRHYKAGSVDSAALAEAFFKGQWNDNGTVALQNGLVIQFGWFGEIGNDDKEMPMAKSFPKAFSTLMHLSANYIGVKTNSTSMSSINDTSQDGSDIITAMARSVDLTQFELIWKREGTSVLSSSHTWAASWIAIGKLA